MLHVSVSCRVSTIWVPSLCIKWSQYPPRLCKLLYIISRLGSIRRGLLQQTWKAREEERTLWACWRSLKCRERQRNRFYTALVTVACGILRGNFAKFSFQKYSRAASGFFDSRNLGQNLMPRASAESRLPAVIRRGPSHSQARRYWLAKAWVTQTRSGSPSLAVARAARLHSGWLAEARVTRRGQSQLQGPAVTRRCPSHFPWLTRRGSSHTPLTESFAPVPGRSHLQRPTVWPSLWRRGRSPSHLRSSCNSPGPESLARARVTRQASRHLQRPASLALTRLTRRGLPSLDAARVTRRGPPSFRLTCPGQSPLPRPESIAADRIHIWIWTWIYTYELDIYQFIHKAILCFFKYEFIH